jgi:predicted RNase H-like nuclease (RuvC/YqgF family)
MSGGRSHSSPDNGGPGPEDPTLEDRVRAAAEHALAAHQAIGSLSAEVAAQKGMLLAQQTSITEFRQEVRESFRELGIKQKRETKKIQKVEKDLNETQKDVTELAEEVEDSKIHNLRVLAGKYRWWKRVALSGAGLTLVGVLTAIIAHYVFHI